MTSTPPLKVVITTPSLHRGGSERQIVEFLRHADRGRVLPHMVTLHPGGGFDQTVRDLEATGLHHLGQCACPTIRSAPRQLFRLHGLLRRLRPDVVYAFQPLMCELTLAAALPLGIPVLWANRCSDVDWSAYSRALALSARIRPLLSRLCAAVVSNSEAGNSVALGQGYPAHKLHLIANGIDTRRFAPAPDSGPAFRKRLGIPANAFVAGIPARIDPIKDHATFLRAAAQAAGHIDGLHLLVVGRAEQGQATALRRTADALGLSARITFAGSVDDMTTAYNAMDACVLCSVSEGFPNALAEAMACGTPCVATRAGDAAGILGDTGDVVPVGDHAALAGALAALAALPPQERARRGRAARRRIQERYAMDMMIEKTCSLFERTARR